MFTGGLKSITRPNASDLIKEKGGIITSSVSKDLDYIVIGDKPGSKYDKAKKLGVTMLNEEEFIELIGG